MIALFFDTETTGIPSPEFSPEIVQIAAILQDTETKRVLAEINLIVTPHGHIPEEVAGIHGINPEVAAIYGFSQTHAEGIFHRLVQMADIVVGHNLEFDLKMLELNWQEAFLAVEDTAHYCTMVQATDIVALPPGEYHQVSYSNHKPPKLREAYEFFTKQQLENAHDAMVDVRACRDVYFGIQEHK